MTTHFLFRYGRQVADGLTLLRALLGFSMVLLGLQGKEALPKVVCITMLAWFTDLIDGRIANRSKAPEPVTWIGRHDAEADLSVVLGITGYLTLSGFMATWLGLGVIVAAIVLRLAHSYNLPWLVIPIPYLTLLVVVLRFAPAWGYVMMGYLLIPLYFGHRRLREQYLPGFFAAIRDVLGR